MRIFFSVGEPSGDLHGANLIRALQTRAGRVEAVGYGGPRMAAAGCQLHEDLTQLAVMWFARALLNLHRFVALVWRADRYFRQHRPDAVVLIDYPGLNWWIARRAKKRGIPVFYYGCPQIWAWARWRIEKMRRYVDHVLCKLPFEEAWYRARGCAATYVGHPYFDELAQQNLDQTFLDRHRQEGPLVTILPGSRNQEITHNLKWLLKAAELVHDQVPEVRFALACFRPEHARMAADQIGRTALPIEVHCQRTPELIHLAKCCMAVSGSVSLELLYHARPTVILYWVGRFAYFVQSRFRTVKYITLVNLLGCDDPVPDKVTAGELRAAEADPVLMPEYLTCEDRAADIAGHVIRWLTDQRAYQENVARLSELRQQVGQQGASQRAARYLLDELSGPDCSTAAGVSAPSGPTCRDAEARPLPRKAG